MMNEDLSPSVAAESADMATDPVRLAALACDPLLAPLVAANPAINHETILYLSVLDRAEIRQALTQNPSVPLEILYKLAREFPADFLQNSLLPLLNLTRPNFVKRFPVLTWLSILRCEEIPPFWLQQFKTDSWYQNRYPQIWKIIQLHIAMNAEAPTAWRQQAGAELKRYQKTLPDGFGVDVVEEQAFFLLCLLLFPQAAAMLKEPWKRLSTDQPVRDLQWALATGVAIGRHNLHALSRKPPVSVRAQVGRHSATPAKTLVRLSRQPQTLVRAAAAGNPHLPLEHLPALLKDTNALIRQQVARRPALSEQDLNVLAQDSDATVRAIVATRHRLSAELYLQLTLDPAEKVRKAVASNVQVPQALLLELAKDPEPGVRAAAAGNPRLPWEAIEALLSDEAELVRSALAGNASLPAYGAQHLLHDPVTNVRKALAANPRIPVDLLQVLLRTDKPEIWYGLAHNPRLSPEQLTYLATHEDTQLRALVAAHKRTPVQVLRQLAQANKKAIWLGLASNPHIPLDILAQIVAIQDSELWFRVRTHPVILEHKHQPFVELFTRKLRTLLVEDTLPAWFRRMFIQYYTTLPAAIVEVFMLSPYWQDRYLVARHPQISQETLQLLAHDGIIYVCMAAQMALEARSSKEKR